MSMTRWNAYSYMNVPDLFTSKNNFLSKMTYFNTTNETGEALATSYKKAKTQEEAIYSYFLSCGEPLSPSMVLDRLALNCPITSIRRAMTNLTDSGKISKTNQYVKGNYGKQEHLWTLNEEKQFSLPISDMPIRTY
jgi:hypothetical protein